MPVEKANNVVIFYGGDAPFSNMYKCSFKDTSNLTFNCVEQYYQYKKVITYGNHILADQIMNEPSPIEQKKLGGAYFIGFDTNSWNQERFEIMFYGNMYKYQQNKHLLDALLDTEYSKLGEASAKDTYWGIGLSLQDPRALLPKYWNGENQMGLVLSNIRYWLSQSISTVHHRHHIIS